MKKMFILLLITGLLFSCRKDNVIVPPTVTPVAPGDTGTIKGFYLLNEGNMGSNKASLDYFDYESGLYSKNIFASRNPHITKELGDVGNDIQIYNGRIYAVINVSNLIEVLDLSTAKHIGTISIPNCRYIVFDKTFAYVSSYAGPVGIDLNARLGYVAKINLQTLKVVDTVVVGYQPEEMVIRNNKLYVANSGGYRVPNYDNTVSIINLSSFKEDKKIEVGINLHRMALDSNNNIFVSSRGNYSDISSNTFIINAQDIVTDTLNIANSNMTISGDSLYLYSTEWNNNTQSNTIAYAIINTKTKQLVNRNFIKDGVAQKINIPYGIAINPETKEIFITDATTYVSPGRLYCFAPDGTYKWDVETGDIPAHIAFTRTKLKD